MRTVGIIGASVGRLLSVRMQSKEYQGYYL